MAPLTIMPTLWLPGPGDPVLADGPEVLYRLADSSGTTALDSSGHNRHGTYGGTVTLGRDGAFSNPAVDFNGTGYVTGAGGFLPTKDVTVEAWVKGTTMATNDQIARLRTADGLSEEVTLAVDTGGTAMLVVTFADGDTRTIPASTPINDGQWHYLAGVVSCDQATGRTTSRLYVDAMAAGADITVTAKSIDTTLPVTLDVSRGGRIAPSAWTGLFLNGQADEVAVYNKALSADRIRAHYGYSGRTDRVSANPERRILIGLPDAGEVQRAHFLDPDTGHIEAVGGDAAAARAVYAKWAPDRTRFFAQTNTEWRIYSASGATLYERGPRGDDPAGAWAGTWCWSADGHYLYVPASGGVCHRIASDLTGSFTQVFTDTLSPAASPDGQYLAFVKDEYLSSVYRRNIDGSGSAVKLIDSASGPSWSPEGSQIAAVRVAKDGGGAYIPVADPVVIYSIGAVRTFASPGGAGSVGRITWSPDGTQIAFIPTGTSDPNHGRHVIIMDAVTGTTIHDWPLPVSTVAAPSWT